jgi:hypothetical protein
MYKHIHAIWHFRFSQLSCCKLKFSRMWHCVIVCIVPAISKDQTAFSFWDEQGQTACPWRQRSYNPFRQWALLTCRVSNSRRLKSSSSKMETIISKSKSHITHIWCDHIPYWSTHSTYYNYSHVVSLSNNTNTSLPAFQTQHPHMQAWWDDNKPSQQL